MSDAEHKNDANTVVLEDEDLKVIADQTKEAIMPDVKDAVATAVAEGQEELLDKFVARTEEVEKKKADEAEAKELANDPVAKGIKEGIFADIAEESKEMRLFKAALALARGDISEVKRYNQFARALRTKAGYANTADDEDGAFLVPDPEFDTTVYENLPKYGVAFKYADVRPTTKNAVRVLSLENGLEFYNTAEAGVKRSAKLQFSQKLTELAKYAVIVPATDELTDDSAIDFWNLVTRELSRAYAKVADEVVFTHATTGITNTAGVITHPVSGAGTTITWDDLLTAEGKTEEGNDESNNKWYMRKETWFRLLQLKGSTNDHYLAGSLAAGWVGNPNAPTTPWGTPVVFTRVLPKSSEVGSNDAFAVYGDLENYILYTKKGMAIKMLSEATIVDSESADLNLATQDAQAMRAVVRMLGVLAKGNASKFVIVGTGTVS